MMLSLLALGCTEAPEADDGTVLGGSIAVLQVEQISDIRAGDSDTASLTAAFAHYQGVEGEQVGKLFGSALPAETGHCGWVDDIWADGGLADGVIELLDAGRIQVEAGLLAAQLTPRTFPELGGLVAGVFYAEDATLGALRADEDSFRFQVSGKREVPPFIATVKAPAEPAEILIGGQILDDGLSGDMPILRRDEDLIVQWAPGSSHDLIEVELRADGDVLQCVGRDDGELMIPAAILETVPGPGPMVLSVRRVRVQSFDAPEFDLAYVRATASWSFDVMIP